MDSATYYIASDTLIRRFRYIHRDQFGLFQALGYTKSSDIVEQKIRKQLDNLKDKTFFKPISELEDTKQYIEKVIIEMKQSDTKIDNSKSR